MRVMTKKSRKPSTNLTLNGGVKEMAQELIVARSFSSLTAMVEQLIRDEYDRRNLKKSSRPPDQNLELNERGESNSVPAEKDTTDNTQGDLAEKALVDYGAKRQKRMNKNPATIAHQK